MFNRINQRIFTAVEYWSATPRLITLVVLFFLLNSVVLASFETHIKAYSNGVGVMDLLQWYSPATALEHITAYTEPGRKLYLLAEWTADLIYPPVYGFMFAGILYKLGAGRWSTLPVYTVLVDYTENIFISIMLTSFPNFSPAVAQVGSTVTSVKWLFFAVTILMVVGFGVRAIYRRVGKRG